MDQLDAMNLFSVERLFRKLQKIEYNYHKKRCVIESGYRPGGRLSTEEQTYFGGLTRQPDTLMVCPLRLDSMWEQVELEANMNKNLRMNREENAALRKSMAKSKGRGMKARGGGGEQENP